MFGPSTPALRFGWFHRTVTFTREGWFFVLVTMAIGVAALNTGHNLFYLVFAMLVSLIVVSSILSERVVSELEVERRLPAEVFARSAAPIEFRVRNQSARRTTYAVEIRHAAAGEAYRRVGFVDRLDPGSERTFMAIASFPRRGRQELLGIHLVTRFPFGLFEKTRILRATMPCIVYPSVAGDGTRRAGRDTGAAGFRKNRLGEEMIGLRRKLPDDDMRRIHWRVSARLGELVVTEHAEPLDRPVVLFFDSRGVASEAFERAVERAATLLWQSSREGRRAELHTWGRRFGGDGAESLRAALAFLAEVEARTADVDLAALRDWRRAVEQSGGGVFVTATEPPELPSGTLLRVA